MIHTGDRSVKDGELNGYIYEHQFEPKEAQGDSSPEEESFTASTCSPGDVSGPNKQYSLDPFTKLPAEIQLEILGQMEIYEADRLVLESYPHLIDLWVARFPYLFRNWFADLCSRDNMQYVGSLPLGVGIDVYRLRSHVRFPMPVLPRTSLGPFRGDPPFDNPPSLADATDNLMIGYEGLAWLHLKGQDCTYTDREGDSPTLLALTWSSPKELEEGDDLERYMWCSKKEMEFIIRNMQVGLRPALRVGRKTFASEKFWDRG